MTRNLERVVIPDVTILDAIYDLHICKLTMITRYSLLRRKMMEGQQLRVSKKSRGGPNAATKKSIRKGIENSMRKFE